MPEVAKVKKALGIPVLAPEREQVVLESTRTAAKSMHLSGDLAVRFMKGQIEAAKRLQHKVQNSASISNAKAEAELAALRRQISALTVPMLEALADIAGNLQYQPVLREIDRQLGQQPQKLPLHDPNIAGPVRDSLQSQTLH